MKKIAMIILLAVSGSALAATDYTCQYNCTSKGYTYGYCKSACSYNSGFSTTIKRTDYTCQNNCLNQGYMYNYCKQACEY